MALIDRLRAARGAGRSSDEPRPEPAEAGLVGPGVLRADQLRAMERVLEREVPMYSVKFAAARAEQELEALPVHEPQPELLPTWVPSFPVDEGREPEPPAPDHHPTPRLVEPEPCPNCGEETRVSRIDLTANAGWLTCRSCGLRWGGTIERTETERERGEAITG
jgi:hypothetical protein